MNTLIFIAIYATTDLVPHIYFMERHKIVMLKQFTDIVAYT